MSAAPDAAPVAWPWLVKILDHGYLELVETWGSDQRIVEAARMSTQKGFEGWGHPRPCDRCKGEGKCGPWGDSDHDSDAKARCNVCAGTGVVTTPGDEKLLRYLYENKHATPFEMAGLVIEVQAPIFVFREWHRHRTQSYNEMSARYTPLPDLNYIPTIDRLMINAGGSNRQAGTVAGAEALDEVHAREFQSSLKSSYAMAEELYQWALARGVPKELARVHLPVGRYSRMRASANLRNWLGFLTLRMDSKAQWEIRQYANAVGRIIERTFPRTWALFAEGRAK